MARYTVWSALVVTAALVTGCGEGKELPSAVLKPDGAFVQQPTAPTKSDPGARTTIDLAAKALTGDRPELLAKGKACRLTLKGVMYLSNPNQPDDTARRLAAVWPDRFHFVNEGEAQGNKLVVESWLRRPDLLVRANGVDQPRAGNAAESEQNFAADVAGQIWMVFLLPATDPKAVVFDPQTVTFESRELRLVKLSLGDYPLFQLYFDGKTDRLVRAEYSVTELGVTRNTTMIFGDYKPGPEGLTLPHQLECLRNKAMVEKWTVTKWELPATIPDDEFSPPKKK